MKPTFTILFLLLIAVNSLSQNKNLTIVKVDGGMIEGYLEDEIAVYKGIPYAAPPVGELRWKAPQPVNPWNGIRKAKNYGNACPQLKLPVKGFINADMSEDCLYLNVWAPTNAIDKKLPVMVWFYGGGFFIGSSSNSVYTGEQFAKRDVIMVSFEYRIGTFGFLAHPELSAESPNHVSGNYGLLDQIAALQWVQRNIKAFGGDPDCVTIFGQSAGGQSVSMLAASPLAKGLFHRAICQSGGSFGPVKKIKESDSMQSLEGAEEEGVKFASRKGANSIAELRKLDADKLIMNIGVDALWPIADGHVIKDDQYKLYQKGEYSDVPVLIGYNSNDGSMFASSEKMPTGYKAFLNERFENLAPQILENYPEGDNNTTMQSKANIYRDSYFGWYTYAWAHLQTKTGKSKVYVYYFDQEQPKMNPFYYGFLKPVGVPHAGEIPYVFNHMYNDSSIHFEANHQKLAETTISYWVNFAKTGNPNGNGVPLWPAYKVNEPMVMNLGNNPAPRPFPNLEAIKLFDQYYSIKRKE
jgi:para-nitrobenzyl esterase